ncbi:hypothetical protein F511_13445 [Dorcoceras hygrometricum]|uniref:Uncharacterized protein n=1 Tax=Dorcoceras hygrometricum TaxID=472368 RepID=A0A2Z7AF99_9LAMI|nr:hypothetical protein F511_13445 [Dorcoceras hygrometricum]
MHQTPDNNWRLRPTREPSNSKHSSIRSAKDRWPLCINHSTCCCPTHEMWELPTPLIVANRSQQGDEVYGSNPLVLQPGKKQQQIQQGTTAEVQDTIQLIYEMQEMQMRGERDFQEESNATSNVKNGIDGNLPEKLTVNSSRGFENRERSLGDKMLSMGSVELQRSQRF